MDRPSEGVKPAKPAAPWLRGNLVTLGSAAVFTVYSAGYFRTRDAAQRFAGESVQRRAAVAVDAASAARNTTTHSATSLDSSTNLPVMRLSSPPELGAENDLHRPVPKAAVAPARPAKSGTATDPSPPAVPAPSATIASVPAVDAPPASTQPSAATASASVAVTPSTPVAPATPVAAPPVAAPPVAAPPVAAPPVSTGAPTVDSAASVAADATGQLKDGTYSGWGTSRHGDIQASVEIKSGKIVGAYIAQCLTRYSCSWISALPPQVLQRQSAEVDYVSGATQSSNAFYYAVAEALKKAK